MHILKKDTKRNILYVTLSGVISYVEITEIKEKILPEIDELQPGFKVVNNISKYIEGDERGGEILQEIISYMVAKGLSKIVRVVGTSKKGLMQFAKFTQEVEGVSFHYVPTLEEAEKLLSE